MTGCSPLMLQWRPRPNDIVLRYLQPSARDGDAAAKLRGALARLRGRGDDGAWVVLFADGGSVAESNAALSAFATSNLGLLESLLRQTRDAR